MANSSSGAHRRSVELTADHALYVDRLVADGAYANDGEVVAAGLQALRERDEGFERWLRDDVGPTYDRMRADPGRGLSADEVRTRLDARHEARLRSEGTCGEP